MQADVINVIQLASLASIVDGHASEQEIEVIAASVAETFELDKDEVKAFTSKLINGYNAENLVKQPVAIVRRGQRAMVKLNGRRRYDAIRIARLVAEATEGVDPSEADFLDQLAQFTQASA